MSRRPDTVRRLTLAALLALAASVSVGDDVVTAPDVRRGSRPVVTDLPDPLGTTTIHVPRMPATGVALVVHNRGAHRLDPLLDALAVSTLIVPVDVGTMAAGMPCDRFVDTLAATSRRAQREAGLTTYRPPVVIGVGEAAVAARGAVAASPPGLFAGGVGPTMGAGRATGRRVPCGELRATPGHRRWRDASAARLVAEADAALGTPLPTPTTGHAPLDRWLTHFALPMEAAWASRPRAVVILMSDARLLRQPRPDLAAALVARDISVLRIDALRYFWQRRSPRDVAFELRRLLGALASLGVPVIVGGQGSGAETMAVAMRLVEPPAPDGLLLVDPGPSAFFEVDPPLPALVPLLRADWSTREAVEALALPTLCVSTDDARARGLCEGLARGRDDVAAVALPPVSPPTDATADDALPDRIARFVTGLEARSGTQPRKPST